jgi:DNA-binding NarL/FixJ family response regulator
VLRYGCRNQLLPVQPRAAVPSRRDFELVESFGSPAVALERIDGGPAGADRTHKPRWELVLMDVDLPGMDGIACTRRIKEQLPDAAVVVLTVFEERATIVEAICAGADGRRRAGRAPLRAHRPGG